MKKKSRTAVPFLEWLFRVWWLSILKYVHK